MNRINALFNAQTRGVLSVYFTAGYPKLNSTKEIIIELADRGVNMIEIGIPSSDSMTDYPVIQSASTQALENGITLNLIFEQLRHIRRKVSIPLILMGNLNSITQYGFENFCRSCVLCGIDGVAIPDLLITEYREKYRLTSERYGIKVVMLISPETQEEHIRLIDKHTDGFIYMSSPTSTSEVQQSFHADKRSYLKRIADMNLHNPCMVGFGISNRSTFKVACEHAVGGIIGSKFITLLEKEEDIEMAVDKLLSEIIPA